MIIVTSLCLAFICIAECAVLDPALYLAPSPPLASGPSSPEDTWTRAFDSADSFGQLSSEHVEQDPHSEPQQVKEPRTFWPSIRTPSFAAIRTIHVPLTFSLTGTYGNSGVSPTGVIGSSYASVSGDGDSGMFKYGKSGLAGSSYGLYRPGLPGTRVYGSGGGAAWSGWGNGKWGHYGKG